ncbi:RagB/SusD family nutrient uptake outer membrane protein [Mangrovibacterium diazotrophicum]|nr:RagB/SusD family nutrient uptake outer membrane protein [Mangrovibacterium diazotrophicum]
MKFLKPTIYTLGLLSMVFLTSCSSFLEETSQDELIPSSLEDLQSTMYAEAYPYNFSSDMFLNLLTDELVCQGLNNDYYVTQYSNGTAMFQFDKAMFDGDYAIPSDANSWKNYYEKIMGCNVVLDYLPFVSGSESEKNAVKGQAQFLRGFYYLRLAMIYCQLYNAEGVNPEQALGVPLVLTMDVTDDFPVRASLKDTYAQIESDLTESIALLRDNYDAPSAHRVSYLAAEAMLSRMYLYMGRDEDWQKVVDYSTDVLAEKPTLTYLSSFSAAFHNKGIYDLDVSEEPIWVYGVATTANNDYLPTQLQWGSVPPYTVSSELSTLYDANDLRLSSYFYSVNYNGVDYNLRPNKIGMYQSNYGDWGIRNAEVYLNRAEAYARLYKAGGSSDNLANALADLNYLRQTRYATGTYEDVDMNDADALLAFCLEERRRELCLENSLRWFDIKRLSLSVTHTYMDAAGVSSDYTLDSGDPLYALPIPYDAINRNYKLEQNPR